MAQSEFPFVLEETQPQTERGKEMIISTCYVLKSRTTGCYYNNNLWNYFRNIDTAEKFISLEAAKEGSKWLSNDYVICEVTVTIKEIE